MIQFMQISTFDFADEHSLKGAVNDSICYPDNIIVYTNVLEETVYIPFYYDGRYITLKVYDTYM